jgi:hypothetical protein
MAAFARVAACVRERSAYPPTVWRWYGRIWLGVLFLVVLATAIVAPLGGWAAADELLYFGEQWVVLLTAVGFLLLTISASRHLFRRT